jgi:hypothetical protein
VPIRWVAGGLFANAYKAKAFAHGCNCQGSMGAGIAKGFRQRSPKMYQEYRTRCKADPRQFNLGDAWLWKDERRPWVFNLGTQEGYWHARASYEAIEESLTRMKVLAEGRRDRKHCHPACRCRLWRAVLEEGAANHRAGLRGLAAYAYRLRGICPQRGTGRRRTRRCSRPATRLAPNGMLDSDG